MKRTAVFIDKDGTLIRDIPFNTDPSLISLEDHAGEGMRRLHACDFRLIVVSNQSGVALGYFREQDLAGVDCRIQELLGEYGVQMDAFYYCPHSEEGIVKEYAIACDCRKPGAGLLLQAAKDFDIHLPGSWMIGDILNDIEAGRRAGCRTILIDNGHETEWNVTEERKPDYIVADLREAARIICHCAEKTALHERLE